MSSGCATDFRYYNYRRVPYLGGSDHYKYLNKMVIDAIHWIFYTKFLLQIMIILYFSPWFFA